MSPTINAQDGEVQLLYLAVLENVVNIVMVREEESRKYMVYYVINTIKSPGETRFGYRSQETTPLFLGLSIMVVPSPLIKRSLHKPKLLGRLAKWKIELKRI